jgi:hypothetical protein
VEQTSRHGAVQLSRRHVALVLGDIVDAINKGGTLASVSGSVGRNLSGTGTVSILDIKINLIKKIAQLKANDRRGLLFLKLHGYS